MPSFLSCFCVRHHRHNFAKRKRDSRKKILSRGTDWTSDSGSDHCAAPEESSKYFPPHSPQDKKTEDEEIMNRLLANQQAPRRRHVEDIFPQNESEGKRSSELKLHRYVPPSRHDSEDTMYGYVPRAVGALSASTALTGHKFDDFFSDCHLNPALDKFAKSSYFQGHPVDPFSRDTNGNRPSIVRVDVTDSDYPATPTHVQIDFEEENAHFDDVMRGSVSSASLSPFSSEEFVSTPDSHHHYFLNQESDTSLYNPSHVQTPGGVNYNTPYDRGLENMFHCDGDVLY